MNFHNTFNPSKRRAMAWLTALLVGMVLTPRCAALWAGEVFAKRPFDVFDGKDASITCSKEIPCDNIHMKNWDRGTCRAGIITLQSMDENFGKVYGNETFRQFPNGSLWNTSDQMSLTLDGCEMFCGGWTWYWDAGPRLTTWVIPVVLLLSNIELSPIDKRRFMTVAHAVGDPIDSFWSILHKIYIWRRLYAIGLSKCDQSAVTWASFFLSLWPRLRRFESKKRRRILRAWAGRATRVPVVEGEEADHEESDDDDDDDSDDYDKPYDRARIIATVLAGFEEIGGAETTSELHYHMLLKRLGNIGDLSKQSEGAWKEWRRCARELAEARTNEIPRTLLAIFIYVFGVAAALYDELGGGNTSKPGGRIGSAVFLMWLVPLSLLSNTVGTFTSRRTCITVMRTFMERVKRAIRDERRQHGHDQRDQEPPSAESGSRPSDGSVAAMSIGSPAMSPNVTPEASPSTALLTRSAQAQAPLVTRSEGRPRNSSHTAAATPSSILPVHLNSTHHRSASESQTARTRSVEFSTPITPGISVTEAQESSQGHHSRNESQSKSPRRGSSSPRGGSTSPRRGGNVSQWPPTPESVEMHSSPNHRRGSSHRRHSPSGVDPLSQDIGDVRRSGSTDGMPEVTHHRTYSSGAPLLGSPELEFHAPRWTTNNGLIVEQSPRSQGATSPVDDPSQGASPSHQEVIEMDPNDQVHLIPSGSWDVYFSWLQPLGAIYTYRPWKINYRSVSVKSHADYPSNWFLFFMSLFPIAVSVIGSFIIIWHAVPVGFSCRHVWVVSVSVAWLLSTAMTVALHKWHPFGANGRTIWVWVIAKDSIIGIASIACVFMSTVGLFNRCFCWSAYMWHRFLPGDWGEDAYVPLNTDDGYDKNAQKIYGPVVFGSLALQLVFFFGVVCLWWDGLYVVRWSEDRCRREWRHELTDGRNEIVYDEDTKLLFWYSKLDLQREESDLRRRRRTYTEEELLRRSRSSIQRAWTEGLIR